METAATVQPITRISVIEDNAVMRGLVAHLSECFSKAECVSRFGDAETALAQLPATGADVVLIDVRLPGEDGLVCARKLARLMAGVRIIVVTGFADQTSAFQALKLGAVGFITKPFTPQEIGRALQVAASGGFYSNANFLRLPGCNPPALSATSPAPSVAALTAREWQVLSLLAAGSRYKEIADELGVSVHTIDNHLARVREKLGAHSTAEVINRVFGSIVDSQPLSTLSKARI